MRKGCFSVVEWIGVSRQTRWAVWGTLGILILLGIFSAWTQETPAGMVLLPAGVNVPFYKTPTSTKPMAIQSFYLDRYPVTNAGFLAFVCANPSWQRSQVKKIFADSSYLKHWQSDLELGPQLDPQSPVTHISWFAAMAYSRWQGKRLPTIAEWEYAGVATRDKPDGRTDPEFNRQILDWYSQPVAHVLPPVGLREPNYWGVYDMHGLTWEWVADFNSALVTGDSRRDGRGEDRQFCGGGAIGSTDAQNYAAFMRYAFRSSLKAAYALPHLGFRCARDVEPTPARSANAQIDSAVPK